VQGHFVNPQGAWLKHVAANAKPCPECRRSQGVLRRHRETIGSPTCAASAPTSS
jgi:hypothetical protein